MYKQERTLGISASTATPNWVLSQLRKYFGDDIQFNSTALAEEIRLMHEDLCSNIKKNCNKNEFSELFICAGGAMKCSFSKNDIKRPMELI